MPDPLVLGKQYASEGDVANLQNVMQEYAELKPDTFVHESYR